MARTRFYTWGTLFLGAFVLFSVTFGSLGLVWMRQRISEVAASSQCLEKSLSEIERKNSSLQSKIAQVQNPEFLIEQSRGLLMPTAEAQLVWVGERIPFTDRMEVASLETISWSPY